MITGVRSRDYPIMAICGTNRSQPQCVPLPGDDDFHMREQFLGQRLSRPLHSEMLMIDPPTLTNIRASGYIRKSVQDPPIEGRAL